MLLNKKDTLHDFREHVRDHNGSFHYSMLSYVMTMILDSEEFVDEDSLLDFCNQPENLRRWLPSGADRDQMSHALVEGLRGGLHHTTAHTV